MLLIQCLLSVIAITLMGGIALIASDLDKMIRNQAITIARQELHHKSPLGQDSDGLAQEISRDLKLLAEFARDARRGRIPNLRYDDWYVTKEDFERWERAEILEAANSGR